jgi:NAD(P)-dependent dehydrogenase (short-subunit alcohol dehydrogenase family)
MRRSPLRKVGSGDDIARAVLFLCTQSDFITGQVLVVDGGYSLT